MISDALYDLAFQFRQTKLWTKLYDSQLFAIRHSDGSIGYCCVMGMMREHLALAVYPGDEGLTAYRMMSVDRGDLNPFEAKELALSQNCLMLSFQNKSELRPREQREVAAYCASRQIRLRGKKAYPQFERYRPFHFPWYIDDPDDQRLIQEALEAALDVSLKLATDPPETLGFTDGAPYDRSVPLLTPTQNAYAWTTIPLPAPRPPQYPAGKITDDLGLAKLAKSRKRGGIWACSVFMHLEPVSDEASPGEFVDDPQTAPYFPHILLIVDNQTGMILSLQLASGPEDIADTFSQAVLKTALENGKPARIRVNNDRTHALLAPIAAQLGAKLTLEDSIPLLDEAMEGLISEFDGQDGSDGPGEGNIADLMEMLRDPHMLEAIPDEILAQLIQAVQATPDCPPDVARNIMNESRKRGLT